MESLRRFAWVGLLLGAAAAFYRLGRAPRTELPSQAPVEPETRPAVFSAASADEKALFDELRTEFDVRASRKGLPALCGPRRDSPCRVDDVLRSFERPVEVELGCGVVRLRTRLAAWNIPSDALPESRQALAQYSWIEPAGGDVRQTAYANVLILNAPALRRYLGEGPRGQALAIGFFYHELLHGQLLVDAMKGDPAWRAGYCRGNVDYGPADLGTSHLYTPHKRIPAIQDAFVQSLLSR